MVKVVVVTGCDSGFGKQAAETLCTLGWHVIAGCFTAKGCEELKKDGERGKITTHMLDVTSDESVTKFGLFVSKECKETGVDGLINNAGVAPTGFVEWAELSDLQKAMDINVYGQIRMTKALLPLIRKAQGRIVNVSSLLGRLAFGGAPWYSCTKFAVEGWTDSLRREMRPFGVTVHLIEPGFFATSMVNTDQYAKALNTQWKSLPDEAKQAYGEQTLTGYIQNVEDQCKMMTDPKTEKVINAMVSALTSSYAKVRYPVGGSARFFFLPISHMPVWMADGITSGLNQKYKPDTTVSRSLPRRLDLAALWLIGVPLLAYGVTTKSQELLSFAAKYPKTLGIYTATVTGWLLSIKMS